MRSLSTISTFLLAMILASCATHQGPTAKSDSKAFIFVTQDEAAVFQAAYDAMLDGRRESPIEDLDGPIRGFMLTRRWALDYWTSTIRIFPATGITADGRTVTGYYPEVSGDGTLIIRGPSMDKRIYSAALERMALIGSRVEVARLTRGTYKFDRDQWRLNQAPSLRDGGTINVQSVDGSKNTERTVEQRLNELDALKAAGRVSDSEFQQMRKAILEDL